MRDLVSWPSYLRQTLLIKTTYAYKALNEITYPTEFGNLANRIILCTLV